MNSYDVCTMYTNKYYYHFDQIHYEPWHDKTKKWQISLGIRPVWSESLLCAQWIAKDPRSLHADSEVWSDWASLRYLGAHSFCWFCHVVDYYQSMEQMLAFCGFTWGKKLQYPEENFKLGLETTTLPHANINSTLSRLLRRFSNFSSELKMRLRLKKSILLPH